MTLKEKYKDYFKIGAAVNTRTIESHKDIILREFNSITCENEMKYISVAPDGVNYDFTNADKIYAFAQENGLDMRLHTFLWHNQVPKEIFDNEREVFLKNFKAHIEKVSARYGSGVYACDVANEVIEDTSDGFFRESPWLSTMGDEFCDIAFKYAKEALPGVTLVYNDYNECHPEKSQKIYRLVKELKERDIPVDCLGMQGHWNISKPTIDEVKRAFELYAKLGVKLHVTELDISVYSDMEPSDLTAPTTEMLKAQTEVYKQIFAIFREYKEILESVTLWGVADDATWLSYFRKLNRKNWPLLFDENHQPKDAYYAVMDF